jgi:Zn-finger nucleic acid-binding protein
MRQYERSGVHVDQCSECRGIFLDRGELEKLIDAESAFNAQVPAPAPAPAAYPHDPRRYESHDRGYDTRHDTRGYDSHGYGHRKKRKSFFEELFD